MTWLRMLASRFLALFGKGRLDQELDDELRSHLAMMVEENLRKGLSAQEARYAARREELVSALELVYGALDSDDTGPEPADRAGLAA